MVTFKITKFIEYENIISKNITSFFSKILSIWFNVIYLPPKTKPPTVEMNPDKKELNGKVPTMQQYTNCIIPVKRIYNKYASTIFSFLGVFLVYSS